MFSNFMKKGNLTFSVDEPGVKWHYPHIGTVHGMCGFVTVGRTVEVIGIAVKYHNLKNQTCFIHIILKKY